MSRDHLEEIERALMDLVRRPSLPRLHAHVASRAGVSVERGALPVMRYVHHHQPIRLSAVAEGLGVDQSTVSRHVARLEAAGLVARRPDPEDGRGSLLEITEEGVEAHRAIHRARRSMLAEVLAAWSHEDRVQLASSLRRLAHDFVAYTERL
jgi:DNA-binding MarR family transcriptional regulator